MKKPTYALWIIWIAQNDDPEEMDQGNISQQTTVCMVADLFGFQRSFVAGGVLETRRKMAKL